MRLDLTNSERSSELWLKIAQILDGKIKELRERNDCDLDERLTQRMRGRIQELKGLLEEAKGNSDGNATVDEQHTGG